MNTVQYILIFAGAVVTAAATVLVGLYASRSSIKTKEIDVKAAAYEVAQNINKEGMEWLRGQVRDIKDAYSELRSEHDELKTSHDRQAEELRQVRTKTEHITEDLQIAINWLEQFLMWEQDGSRPPRPHIPARLRKYIKQELLIEQRQEQLEHNREDV